MLIETYVKIHVCCNFNTVRSSKWVCYKMCQIGDPYLYLEKFCSMLPLCEVFIYTILYIYTKSSFAVPPMETPIKWSSNKNTMNAIIHLLRNF